MRRFLIVAGAVSLMVAACGGGTGTSSTTSTTAGSATTTTATATTTTAAATSTTAAATSTTAGSGEALTEVDGVYTIDWSALEGDVFFAPAGGGADPFFHVHTTPAVDGFFFSVEAYTTGFGPTWTGQLGTFPIECIPTGTGICVHFDPDGSGPIANLGADGLVTGDVEIIQADAEGFEAVFSNVMFSDGSTIPGPFTVTG